MKIFPRLHLLALSVSVLALGLEPQLARAADAADNAYIPQDYPDGAGGTNQVPTQIVFNSNQVGQDIVVLPGGKLGIRTVITANLSSVALASGSATSLTTATPKTIAQTPALGVGTWRIYGYVDSVLASATSTTMQTGIATTTNSFTNSFQAQDTSLASANALTTTSTTLTTPTPFLQVTITSGTQVFFLVEQNAFSAGTETGYGTIFYQQLK